MESSMEDTKECEWMITKTIICCSLTALVMAFLNGTPLGFIDDLVYTTVKFLGIPFILFSIIGLTYDESKEECSLS